MTREEFVAHLLLGFNHAHEYRGRLCDTYRRYYENKAYDVIIDVTQETVNIKYDLDPPDPDKWPHKKFGVPFAEAWEFISAFLQAHPDE